MLLLLLLPGAAASHLLQDIRVGHNDAQVNIHWRHQTALQLELPKLYSLWKSQQIKTVWEAGACIRAKLRVGASCTLPCRP